MADPACGAGRRAEGTTGQLGRPFWEANKGAKPRAPILVLVHFRSLSKNIPNNSENPASGRAGGRAGVIISFFLDFLLSITELYCPFPQQPKLPYLQRAQTRPHKTRAHICLET